MSRVRGQCSPRGAVECNNSSSRNTQMPRCPPRNSDLVSTPEHLRPGFRGRPLQCDPSDFGLTGDEEWRHPRTFKTDPADLPEECLMDESAPDFGEMSDLRGECIEDESATVVNDAFDTLQRERAVHTGKLYHDILDCFRRLGEGISGSGRRRNFPLPNQSANLMDESMPSYREVTRDALENESMPAFESFGGSCLENETMPSSRSRRRSPRRQQQVSMPSQNLCDVSAPSFANSTMNSTTNECLEDVSMPSFEGNSHTSRSRSRSASKVQRSRHKRNLSNSSAPVFGSTRRGQTTNECLEDITMPSMKTISIMSPNRSGRRPHKSMSTEYFSDSHKRKPPSSECLEDISMPTCGGLSESSRGRTSRRQPNTSECLDDMTMPSFGGVSGTSRSRSLDRHHRSKTSTRVSECLDDITMPSFGGISGSSRRQTTRPNVSSSERSYTRRTSRRQRPKASQNIGDTSAPSFANSTKYGETSECLQDISMPSFDETSGASRSKSTRRQQMTMPSQNINDISAPVFANSGRGNVTNECLEDITMPSFRGDLSASRREQSSCHPSLRGYSTSKQDLNGIPMSAIDEISFFSGVQKTLPRECLNDVSAPSFGASTSRGASRSHRTLPTRNLSRRSGASRIKNTSRQPKSSSTRIQECLEDVTMPSYEGVSGISRTRSQLHRSMPSMTNECLDNETMPSFGERTPRRQQISMQTQNISGISAPSFAPSGRRFDSNECIEDISMPSYADNTRASRNVNSTSMQRSRRGLLTNECLDDVTMPSFAASRRGPLTSECLEDISMPSYRGNSLSSRGNRSKQIKTSRQATMTNECLDDMTMPSFGNSSHFHNTNECLQVSRTSRGQSPKQVHLSQEAITNECLDDMTMPSFGISNRGHSTNECLEDISMPSYRENSLSSRRNRSNQIKSSRQATMTNECLDDMTMPSFGDSSRFVNTNECLENSRSFRGQSPKQVHIPQEAITNERLDEMTMPSFGMSSRRATNNECLEDISMPSYGESLGLSRDRKRKSMSRQNTMTNECLNDVTMPSFGISSRGDTVSKCLEDISMPSCGEHTLSSRGRSLKRMNTSRQATMTNECLDDITMPSFGTSSRFLDTNECLENSRTSRSQSPKQVYISQGAMTNECLDDMTMPSFSISNRGPSTNECLEDISMPSCRENSLSSRGNRSNQIKSSRQATMTNECLDDMTMPSFGDSSRFANTNECLEKSRTSRSQSPKQVYISQGAMTNECLDDMTMPSFGFSNRGHSNNECLEDISMPSYRDNSLSSRGNRSNQMKSSRQATMTNECLDDMTMPSFGDSSRFVNTNECLENSRSFRGQNPKQVHISQGAMTTECLDDMTMPSFGVSSRRASTNECLENISMPSYGGNSRLSRGESHISTRSSRRGMMTNECLDDMTMPSFGDSSRFANTNECLEKSRTSRSQSPKQVYISQGAMTNECLDDMTMPSFGFSNRGHSNNECLEDISMPSYRDNSLSSRGNRSNQMKSSRQATMTNECLDDMTMPSFGDSSRFANSNECLEKSRTSRSQSPKQVYISQGAMTNECLDDMTMPSFGISNRGHSTNECLEDISMPSCGGNTLSSRGRRSLNRTQFSRQGVMTNECLDDMTMPSFGSSRREATANECLEDISMPSYGGISRVSRGGSRISNRSSRRVSMTNECLDDMTMPSFGNSSRFGNTNECLEKSRSYRGQSPKQVHISQRVMTNECLDDMTMPSFGNSSRFANTNKCLENSRSSRGQSPTMTNECLDDMTMPSFGDSSRFANTNECLENSRSFRDQSPKQVHLAHGAMTDECLDDMTMPSINNSSRGFGTNERLDDISMPSFQRNTASFRERSPVLRQRSRQEPSTNEFLDDMTMPSYEMVFGSPSRENNMKSECLNEVSAPTFAGNFSEATNHSLGASRAKSPRQPQMSLTNECLEDMTMPTFGGISGSSRLGQSAMPPGLSHRTQFSECVASEKTNECLEDVSAPSFAPSSHMASSSMPQLTNECLEDVSMPPNDSLSRNDTESIARRPPDISYPSEMLANESAPSYNSRQLEADNCECATPQQNSKSRPWENDSSADGLEAMTRPTCEDVSYQPRRHQLTMPCEKLEDITEPSGLLDECETGGFNSTDLPSSTRSEKYQGRAASQQKRDANHNNTNKQLADDCAPSILKDPTKASKKTKDPKKGLRK